MLLTHTALALVPSRTARKTFLHAYRMHALLQYQRFGVMRSVVGMFRQIGPLTDAVSASYILPTALSIPLCQLNAARETGEENKAILLNGMRGWKYAAWFRVHRGGYSSLVLGSRPATRYWTFYTLEHSCGDKAS